VKAASQQVVTVADVAPGQTVCFAKGARSVLTNANANGVATATVKLQAGTGERTYAARVNGQNLGTVTFKALGATTFKVTKKNKVKAGKNQRATVQGLAVGEKVRLKYKNKVVAQGKANAKGKATLRFSVGKKKGKATFRVIGQFGNRKASKNFQIK